MTTTPPARVLAGASDEQLVAALEVMYFVAKADGFVGPDELRHFLKIAKTISDGRLSSTQLSDWIGRWKEQNVGLDQRVGELAEVLGSHELRRATYDLASQMATVDGQLAEAEMSVVNHVGDALGVT